jgi:hypothetical protein
MDNIDTRGARTRAPSRHRQIGEGANHLEADVGPHVWRERHGQSAVLGHRGVVDLRETSSLLLREKGLEGLMHDLGHGRPIELGLPADGLEPALFALEGHALRLAAGILGRLEGFPPASPPVDELMQVVEHRRRYPWGAMRSIRGGQA